MVATGSGAEEGVTTDDENRNQLVLMNQLSWREFKMYDGRLVDRGGHWLMYNDSLYGILLLFITRCTKGCPHLSVVSRA